MKRLTASWGLAFSLSLGAAAAGEPARYQIVARSEDGPGITVEVPYTFGTHRVSATQIEDEIQLERATLEVRAGRFRLRIDALKSDDPKRDCHMREALGLNYANSRFPKDHVCNDQNQLPTQGSDAVAFPTIEFLATGSKALDDPRQLEQGKEVRVQVNGKWTIHGVTRPARLQLTVSVDPKEPTSLRLRGRESFVLEDYGIVVKSANLFITSSVVRGGATAIFDLRLKPSP